MTSKRAAVLRHCCSFVLTGRSVVSRQLLCRASAAGDTIVFTRGWRGLSVISSVNYHDPRHKAWREKVLRRAGYLCEECARYGRKTEATVAHHIRHADEYPELRYVVSNGRALCAACHNKEHPEKGRGDLDSFYS